MKVLKNNTIKWTCIPYIYSYIVMAIWRVESQTSKKHSQPLNNVLKAPNKLQLNNLIHHRKVPRLPFKTFHFDMKWKKLCSQNCETHNFTFLEILILSFFKSLSFKWNPHGELQIILYGRRWCLLSSPCCAKSCESKLAHGSYVYHFDFCPQKIIYFLD